MTTRTLRKNETALDALRRFRALACAGSFVVLDGDREVMTLERTQIGTTSAYAVDARYETLALAISREEIPFSEIRCSGEIPTEDFGGDFRPY